MPLILAIEPDRRQAARIAAIAREELHAELVVADSAEKALEALAKRTPDLLLTPHLLSPKDEAALDGRLRELDAAGLHVQTLMIPVLASSKGREGKKDGLLGRLRRSKEEPSTDGGCDPSVFAGQIKEYLERAAEDRAALAALAAERAEDSEPTPPVRAAANVPTADSLPDPIATMKAAFRESVATLDEPPRAGAAPVTDMADVTPVAMQPLEEWDVPAAPEPEAYTPPPVPYSPPPEPYIAPESVAAPVERFGAVDILGRPMKAPLEPVQPIEYEPPPAFEAPTPGVSLETAGWETSGETVSDSSTGYEPLVALEPSPVVETSPVAAVTPSSHAVEAHISMAVSHVVADETSEETDDEEAFKEFVGFDDISVVDVPSVALGEFESAVAGMANALADDSDFGDESTLDALEVLAGPEISATFDLPSDSIAMRNRASAPHGVRSTESEPEPSCDDFDFDADLWMPLPTAGARRWPALEGPTVKATLTPSFDAPPDEPVKYAPAPKKSKRAKPPQDEWGFFDPGQCGFAALLAKLDEVTDSEESA